MKKILAIIFIIFLVIITILYVLLKNAEADVDNVKKINSKYEYYKDREIYGTNLATVINKIIDSNEKYNIQKDENGKYINDNKYCIKADIYMTTNDKTYEIESIYKLGISKFIDSFNLVSFKCTNIEYHEETGLVSKLMFTQLDDFTITQSPEVQDELSKTEDSF